MSNIRRHTYYLLSACLLRVHGLTRFPCAKVGCQSSVIAYSWVKNVLAANRATKHRRLSFPIMESPFDLLPSITGDKLPFEPYPGATSVIGRSSRTQTLPINFSGS